MSLTSDLRLIASAVEVQRDALERLVFCTRVFLQARTGTGDEANKRDQLVEALKFAENFV